MSDTTITYICPNCGYVNTWSYDEIVRRRIETTYRAPDYELYSLPCQNETLRPPCEYRRKIRVTNQKAISDGEA